MARVFRLATVVSASLALLLLQAIYSGASGSPSLSERAQSALTAFHNSHPGKQADDYDLCVPVLRQIIAMYDNESGKPDRTLARAHLDWAEAAYGKKRYEESFDHFGKGIACLQAATGENSPKVSFEMQIWALRYHDAGLPQKASALYLKAIAIDERNNWRDSDQYRLALLRCLQNYVLDREYGQSIPILKKAVACLWTKTPAGPCGGDGTCGVDFSFLADCLHDTGDVLIHARQFAAAEPLLLDALRIREALEKSRDIQSLREEPYLDTADTLCALGRACLGLKAYSRASAYLTRAQKLMETKINPGNFRYLELMDARARLALLSGRPAEAARYSDKAYRYFQPPVFVEKSLFAVYYKCAERLARNHWFCWWWERDADKFIDYALSEAERCPAPETKLAFTYALRAHLELGVWGEADKAKASVEKAEKILLAESPPSLSAAALLLDMFASDCQKHDYMFIVFEMRRKQIMLLSCLAGKKGADFSACCRRFIDQVKAAHLSDRVAAEQFEPVLPVAEPVLDATRLVYVYPIVADEYEMAGKYYDAMICYRKLVAKTRQLYGDGSRQTGEALRKYGRLLEETNDIAGAAQANSQADAILKAQ